MSSEDWIAVATIALVLVTGAYVFFTGRLARHASRSTEAAEKSASSAEQAARAAERAARVAEAGLNIDFEAELVDETDTPDQWIAVTCRGARVYVHGAKGEGIFHSQGKVRFLNHNLAVRHPGPPPIALHRGEYVIFGWPGGPVDNSQPRSAAVEISFSLEPDDQPSTIRRSLTFPAGPV